MASYYLIPALAKLRTEVNTRWLKRDKTSDGWIGDPDHAARPSSHNPDYARGGAVRAVDLDVDDNDPHSDLRLEVVSAAKGDPRVWYVISNGIIWSRTYGWTARRYTGSNGHFKHVHVSAVEDQRKWTDTTSWFDDPRWAPNFEVISDFGPVRDQVAIAAGLKKGTRKRYHGNAFLQNALNVKAGAHLTVDGYIGPNTITAMRKAGLGATLEPADLKKLQIAYRFKGLPK